MRPVIILTLLFILFFSGKNPSETVTLKQIGQKDLLFGISDIEYFGGNLYTLDDALALNKINLETGESSRLGNVTYKNKKFFFALNARIYIIETDGSMDEIDSQTGEWKTISAMSVWMRTERTIVVRNSLYTIENGSLFYHRGANYDNKEAKGGNEFYNPGFLVRGQTSLYSVQGEGSLYQINLADGNWNRITKTKQWKGTKAAAIWGDKLYTVDQAGNFSQTLLTDGTKTVLDQTQFTDAKLLFADRGKLYLITVAGNLYEVQIGA